MGRTGALAEYDGRGAQSPGLSAAHREQSHTAKDDGRDRGSWCSHRKKDHQAAAAQRGTRLRIEGKAPVSRGEGARGGLTRGDAAAWDHDLGLQEQDSPWGLVEADRAQLPLPCGRA